MSTLRYIKAVNLPPRIGLIAPAVWFLVLERFGAPGWVYGVVYTFIAVVWAAEVYRLFRGEAVDVLEKLQ
jgi:hypothetical protein